MPLIYQDARKELFKDYVYTGKDNKEHISFENIEFDNSNNVLFQEKRQSYKYYVFNYNELNTIKHNNHLYEVITKNTYRKIFLDLDFKDKETKTKLYISYNEVNILCTKFVDFLKTTYNIQQNITYIIQGSINDNFVYDNNDKVFNSFHVIFNVYTKTDKEQLQIITDFCKLKYDNSNFIDRLLYKNRTTIRALHQSKEKLPNEIFRTDKFKILNINDNQIITDYYITSINKERDILLEVAIREKETPINTDYNVVYKITQLEDLKEYITDLKYNDLIINKLSSNFNWSNNLNLILTVLKLEGIKWVDILNNDLIKLYLEKSKVGEYDNIETYEQNIKYIETICKKQKVEKVINNKFFIGLTHKEIQFIYSKLKKDKEIQLIFTKLMINNKAYINILENENVETTTNKLTLYDINKYILLVNANIYKDNIINTKIIKTTEQYNLYIDKIINLKSHNFNTNKCIDITNWNETTTQSNISCYYEAPVGSRKSSERMNLDIKAILQENQENIILMPCDTRSLCNSQNGKMTDIFNELNINISFLKIYLKTKPDKINKTNTRLFICCYDSIYNYKHIKFTHIIIDEYLNVRKRFMNISGCNMVREEHLKNFFRVLKNSKTIKCYDADLQNNDLDLLNKYSNKELIYYKLKDFIQVNNTILFTNYNRQKEDIINSILNNKNFSISSNSKKEAERLYNWIKHLKPLYKIALITKDGAINNDITTYNEDLKVELTTYTKKWEKYNVIIYTPTIMTGISQDSNKYFYKHYGFLCCDSTDHTQTAQMLFRVRNTETNIIMLCDIKNRLGCLIDYCKKDNVEFNFIEKNYSKYYRINEDIENEDIEINESIEENSTEIDNNDMLKDYINLVLIEDNEKKQFYYNLFYTLKKWGCNNIKCEFYDYIQDIKPEIKRDLIDYKNVNMLEICNFQEFIKLEYCNNVNVERNPDNDKHINKTLSIMKYGINSVTYNHLKYNDYYNYFLYNELVNNNYEYNTYKRLSKLTYYSIKNVIYKMVDYVLIDIKNIETLFMKQTKINDTEKFLNWLLCSFILFKLFDNKEQEYNKFLVNILNCEEYNIDMKEENIKKINEDIKPLKTIITLFKKKKLLINDNIETLLNQLCKFYYLDPNHKIENDIYVFSRHSKIPYRLETNNYILEKNNNNIDMIDMIEDNEYIEDNIYTKNEDHDLIEYQINETIKTLNKNEYDDIINYINKDIKLNLYDKQLNYCYIPKIRLFDSYKESSNIKKLISSFDIYYNDTNKTNLNDLLDIELNKLNKKSVKVAYNDLYNNVEVYIKSISKSENQYKYINEDINILEGEILKQSKIPYIQVSNLGNVYYINKEENIKCRVKEHNFIMDISNNRLHSSFKYSIKPITISNNINYKYIYVNEDIIFIDRLICECFLSDYRNDFYIKHKDNNYTNNNIDNLEMVEKWVKLHYKDLLKNNKETIKEEKKTVNHEKRIEKRNEKIQCDICNKMYSYTHKKRHYETHTTIDLVETVEPIAIVEQPIRINTFDSLTQEEQIIARQHIEEHMKQEGIVAKEKKPKSKIQLKKVLKRMNINID